jgi:streptomycin 6-kinase
MEDMEIPAHLLKNWVSWSSEEKVRSVAADVQQRLGAAVQRWGLEGLEPLGGGEVSLVCSGRRRGQPVVLKINPRFRPEKEAIAYEVDALVAWRGSGLVPEVYEVAEDGYAVLLERIQPGTQLLEHIVRVDEQMETLGALAAQLHSHVVGVPAVPIYEEGERYREITETFLEEGMDEERRRFLEMIAEAKTTTLLHSDLHPKNVLFHHRGWCVIDPKPYIGDPHLDNFALLYAPGYALPENASQARRAAESMVARYAGAAGLEETRLVELTRLHALSILAWARDRPSEREWCRYLSRLVAALS